MKTRTSTAALVAATGGRFTGLAVARAESHAAWPAPRRRGLTPASAARSEEDHACSVAASQLRRKSCKGRPRVVASSVFSHLRSQSSTQAATWSRWRARTTRASLRPQIAIGKAWGALGMGRGSRELARRAEAHPGFYAAVSVASEGHIFSVPGGVLVRDFDGELSGAVGVSGDLPDNDEQYALAWIELAGHVGQPE